MKAIGPEVNWSYQSSLLKHPTRRQNFANTLKPHCAHYLAPRLTEDVPEHVARHNFVIILKQTISLVSRLQGAALMMSHVSLGDGCLNQTFWHNLKQSPAYPYSCYINALEKLQHLPQGGEI